MTLKVKNYEQFSGVDYTHPHTDIADCYATDGVNMIRSQQGKVKKRTGYFLTGEEYSDKIHAVHHLSKDGENIRIVHNGTALYKNGSILPIVMNDAHSHSVQLGAKLYIADGEKIHIYDGDNISALGESAYIPTVSRKRTPQGQGEKGEEPNILTALRTDSFVSDGISNMYVLSSSGLSGDTVSASIYDDQGNVVHYSTGNGLTVNTASGIVTFSSVIPRNIRTDTDNVFITYSKQSVYTVDNLSKCRVLALSGKNNRPDTLFLSGNPQLKNLVWYSHPQRPDYFAENDCFSVGDTDSDIAGFSVCDSKLFIHKNGGENMPNVFIAESKQQQDSLTYEITAALHCSGAVSQSGFVNMGTEPLFLTYDGVFGLKKSEFSDYWLCQRRSEYIDTVLKDYTDKSKISCIKYGDYYALSVENEIYLMDTTHKISTRGDISAYQYAVFHWRIPDKIAFMFCEGEKLFFATRQGKIAQFYTDYHSPDSFNDNGAPIRCVWEFGESDLSLPSRYKSILNMYITCFPSIVTSFCIEYKQGNVWKEIFLDSARLRYFSFSKMCFSKFTFSTDMHAKTAYKKLLLRNCERITIRISNSQLNEPFEIYGFGYEYSQDGYIR